MASPPPRSPPSPPSAIPNTPHPTTASNRAQTLLECSDRRSLFRERNGEQPLVSLAELTALSELLASRL